MLCKPFTAILYTIITVAREWGDSGQYGAFDLQPLLLYNSSISPSYVDPVMGVREIR